MSSALTAAYLSDRLLALKPSATGAMSQAARELTTQGRLIISLSEGELDFDTPVHIQHAAIRAIVEGETRYTDVGGTPRLKAAIVDKFRRDNDLSYESSEVIASTGAKQILFNAFLATLNEGDEAIVVAPYWVSYTEIETDADLARYLLHDAGVAVVPGTAFGMAPYLRLAYAVSDSRLQEACERIVAACLRLA